MYSIREASGPRRCAAAAAAVALLATGGCYVNQQNPPPIQSSEPPTDRAMAMRHWPEVSAYFANGSTVAGYKRFPLEPDPKAPRPAGAITSTATFVGNLFFLPFSYFIFPPFAPKVYHEVSYTPTYTAVPKLPPETPQPMLHPGQTYLPGSFGPGGSYIAPPPAPAHPPASDAASH